MLAEDPRLQKASGSHQNDIGQKVNIHKKTKSLGSGTCILSREM